MIQTKSLDLFAGIPVTDYAAALKWYERLLGSPPTFFPHNKEAVWELAEHFQEIRRKGAIVKVEPERRPYGMTDFTVLDPDGNHLTFGCQS
jgi:hypothetical protein